MLKTQRNIYIDSTTVVPDVTLDGMEVTRVTTDQIDRHVIKMVAYLFYTFTCFQHGRARGQ